MKNSMRRLIIDRMISEKGIVKSVELQAVLGVSEPTLKRDLRYMREELNAPIVYSRAQGGYVYSKRGLGDLNRPVVGRRERNPDGTPQRHTWFNSEELYTLLSTIDNLEHLSRNRHSVIYRELEPLRARVANLLTIGEIAPKEMLSRMRVISDRVPYLEKGCFKTIGAALCERRQVLIEYYTNSRGEASERVISPCRLVHYKNRWYVDAYCHKTDSLRTFLIDNVWKAEILEAEARRISIGVIQKTLDESYGIFRGKDIQTAEILVRKDFVQYIMRESWHPHQQLMRHADGTATLTVPYANPTELVGQILRWGTGLEVKAPASLRGLVAEQAAKIVASYQTK